MSAPVKTKTKRAPKTGRRKTNGDLMHQHTNVAPTTFQLELATELANRFRREAIAHDMPVRRLILELLDIITQDKLIDAILDKDASPPPPHKPGRPKGSVNNKKEART
jgi:hypothetical protein